MRKIIVSIFVVILFWLESYGFISSTSDLMIIVGLTGLLFLANFFCCLNMFSLKINYTFMAIFTIFLSLLIVVLGLLYDFHLWRVYTDAILLGGISSAVILYDSRKKYPSSAEYRKRD